MSLRPRLSPLATRWRSGTDVRGVPCTRTADHQYTPRCRRCHGVSGAGSLTPASAACVVGRSIVTATRRHGKVIGSQHDHAPAPMKMSAKIPGNAVQSAFARCICINLRDSSRLNIVRIQLTAQRSSSVRWLASEPLCAHHSRHTYCCGRHRTISHDNRTTAELRVRRSGVGVRTCTHDRRKSEQTAGQRVRAGCNADTDHAHFTMEAANDTHVSHGTHAAADSTCRTRPDGARLLRHSVAGACPNASSRG